MKKMTGSQVFGGRAFGVFALCVCLMTGIPQGKAFTEPNAEVLEEAASPKAEVLEETASPKAQLTEEGKYFLDFKSAALINVLNVLSSLSGINFVAGREVADRQVNMTLDNAVLDDVLQSLSYGCNVTYEFIPGKNIYIFRASSDSPEKPALMTRVFKLYYVRVTQLKEIESSGSSSGGSSSGSSSSGSSSGGSSSGGLATLQADESTDNLEDSAIYKAIEKILSERGKVSVDDRSNSLIVTDSEDRLKMIESAIAQLDRPLDQVLINVLLVETVEDLDRDLGVEWGDSNGVFGTVTGGIQATNFPFTDKGSSSNPFASLGDLAKDAARQFNPDRQTGAITQGTRDFTSFQIKVQALESASKLKILAKPKILALDNHPALIKISTNAAIGEIATVAGGSDVGSVSTSQAERAEVGTILRVTPLINSPNRITMTVEPTFATVDQSAISIKAAGSGSTGDPTVRTARTTMMVSDGQTIALGGLLFSTQSNGNRKVPFFGNLPVVGKALFTSNTKSLKDRELILFVTPRIITDPAMLETSDAPEERRRRFEDEVAPFWKVDKKQWYKELKNGPEKDTDFDSYFAVRDKMMNQALGNLSNPENEVPQAKR